MAIIYLRQHDKHVDLGQLIEGILLEGCLSGCPANEPRKTHHMNTEELYQQRLKRYVTAMRNEKPDMIPIRPFVAEFVGKFSGYTCQEVTHDYEKAFDAEIGRAHV